jgi:hypothetical protein
MVTSDQKQELIDYIKRPLRHYKILLGGYGSEVVYGRSSQEEYDYWETNIEERRRQFNIPEDESPFNRYIMDKEDIGGYEAVPENLKRKYDWFEEDDVDHGMGVNYQSAYLIIVEFDDAEETEIETIVEEDLPKFIDYYNIDFIVGDSEAVDIPYLYSAVSAEKGIFFDGRLTTNGKIDLSKFRFECTEYPNGEILVNHVFYGGQELDNYSDGTNSKGLYIELLDLRRNQ